MRAGVVRVFGKQQSSDAPPTLGMWRNGRGWECGRQVYIQGTWCGSGGVCRRHTQKHAVHPQALARDTALMHTLAPVPGGVGKWGLEILSWARWGWITA